MWGYPGAMSNSQIAHVLGIAIAFSDWNLFSPRGPTFAGLPSEYGAYPLNVWVQYRHYF